MIHQLNFVMAHLAAALAFVIGFCGVDLSDAHATSDLRRVATKLPSGEYCSAFKKRILPDLLGARTEHQSQIASNLSGAIDGGPQGQRCRRIMTVFNTSSNVRIGGTEVPGIFKNDDSSNALPLAGKSNVGHWYAWERRCEFEICSGGKSRKPKSMPRKKSRTERPRTPPAHKPTPRRIFNEELAFKNAVERFSKVLGAAYFASKLCNGEQRNSLRSYAKDLKEKIDAADEYISESSRKKRQDIWQLANKKFKHGLKYFKRKENCDNEVKLILKNAFLKLEKLGLLLKEKHEEFQDIISLSSLVEIEYPDNFPDEPFPRIGKDKSTVNSEIETDEPLPRPRDDEAEKAKADRLWQEVLERDRREKRQEIERANRERSKRLRHQQREMEEARQRAKDRETIKSGLEILIGIGELLSNPPSGDRSGGCVNSYGQLKC